MCCAFSSDFDVAAHSMDDDDDVIFFLFEIFAHAVSQMTFGICWFFINEVSLILVISFDIINVYRFARITAQLQYNVAASVIN